jgi:hypothetical protein
MSGIVGRIVGDGDGAADRGDGDAVRVIVVAKVGWKPRLRALSFKARLSQKPLKPRTAVKTQTCIGLSWTWAC